jgi:hypothetical protein
MLQASWAERKAVGSEHEQRVWREFEARNHAVARYGQGILPAPIQRALGATDSIMRWDPDLIVAQGTALALIDCKASMRGNSADRYTISKKALRAHLRMSAERELPFYYVFSNLGVATPHEVMQFCGLRTLGAAAGGYVSFLAGRPHPFDEVFGCPVAEGANVAA